MKDSGAGTNGVAQSAKPNQLATISERKLRANRENAKKSTGPSTLRGKSYSRRNALKHGFFAKNFSADFMLKGEDPNEFRELIEQLLQVYRPVGAAEQLEVERIAVCWLRHRRALRYENAELAIAQVDTVLEEHDTIAERVMIPEFKMLIQLLESAENEVIATGSISQELQEKMFTSVPRLRDIWRHLEYGVKRAIQNKKEEVALSDSENPRWSMSVSLQEVRRLLPDMSSSQVELPAVVALATTKLAMRLAELNNSSAFESYFRMEYDRQALPNADAMRKIIVYEAANDRSLARAYDRLERLQRRRKGEHVPPPLRVGLTQ